MLNAYGWNERLQRDFEAFGAQGLIPGRVILQNRAGYRLVTAAGEVDARATGRLMKGHEGAERPVAGDWVAAEPGRPGDQALVRAVLPRSTAFVRKAAGRGSHGQVVAANADLAFLMTSLNADFNLRRLERYLALAHESGAAPVVVLTKSDLAEDVAARLAEARAVALEAPVLAISARTGEGLDALRATLTPGSTAVLLGTSGAGKSTLLNTLFGAERMATQEVRADDARGRHTTTHRELVRLPSGALILDTPGMRELGLWEAEAGVAATFADVEALAQACRFSDCGHGSEPGCAVRAAMAAGELAEERWGAYEKLQAELAHERRREDPRAQADNRRLSVSRQKGLRARLKEKRGEEE